MLAQGGIKSSESSSGIKAYITGSGPGKSSKNDVTYGLKRGTNC
jgi:hypothetical protein